jgi:hypothetical protein
MKFFYREVGMQRFSWRFLRSSLVLFLCVLAIPGITIFAPGNAHAFGSLTENGTAAFMGIGINPTKILHVSGSGPGSVPLFSRASDSAGFIIERTSTNRWVLGVNESPTLGNGFVLSTIPFGTTSVPRLLVTQDGKVGIGTLYPTAQLHVEGSSYAVKGVNTTRGTTGFLGHEDAGVQGYGAYPYWAGSFNGALGFNGIIKDEGIVHVSTDYYLNANTQVNVIIVNATENMSIYLPPITDVRSGRIYTIKRADSTTYSVTVRAYTGDNIEWWQTHVLAPQKLQFITLISDSNYAPYTWWLISDSDAQH